MSRPPSIPRLPNIAVEDETTKRSIAISKALDAELATYGEYFTAIAGKRPRSHDDVIIGILGAYLAQDVCFQKWKKERETRANGKDKSAIGRASQTLMQASGGHG